MLTMEDNASNNWSEKYSLCLGLLNKGGGLVNVEFNSADYVVSDIFDSSWVLREMPSLSMLTVALPRHGCFSLLHPGVISWEENRNDIPLLDEEDSP